jgi:hypothetical protein
MSQDKEPRRRFLRQVLAIVPAATTLGGATTVAVSQQAIADSSEPGKPRAYTPTYFNAAEWAFINAAVDHLIPSDQYGAGALETGVPEFIDRQMETPYGAGKLWYMQGPSILTACPNWVTSSRWCRVTSIARASPPATTGAARTTARSSPNWTRPSSWKC